MTDFFDRVEQQLVGAVEREAARGAGAGLPSPADGTAPEHGRGRIAAWLAGHSAVILIGGAVAVGAAGATAAVVSIHGTPSPKSTGIVPPVPHDHRKSTWHYRLSVFPDLTVGRVGWCQSFAVRTRPTERESFGSGGCGATIPGSHGIGGGTMFLGAGRGVLMWSVVDRTVAYGTVASGERIVPADDPRLPNHWRAIIVFPGKSHDGKITLTSLMQHVSLRDSSGREIDGDGGVQPRRIPDPQPTEASEGSVPSTAACTIAAPPRAHARGSHWLLNPAPTLGLKGYAYLPCAQSTLQTADGWAEVTVLLDAARPGAARPADLAGATASPSGHDTVDLSANPSNYLGEAVTRTAARGHFGPMVAGNEGSARRVGNAWVVVRAKFRALREHLLDGVTVGLRIP